MSPWVGMIIISFLTSLLMLFVFRFTSNQQGIRNVKNKIKAHLLEIRLFKDSLGISLKAQGNILRYNLKYIGYTTKPLLVMIIPLVLILIQLNLWFGFSSLTPGQKAILKAELDGDQSLLDTQFVIEAPPGLKIESPPLRIQGKNEVNWRLQATEPGIHELTLMVNGQRLIKKVAVAQKQLSKISSIKIRRNFIDELFNPGEAPIPGKMPVKTIKIEYPAQQMNLFGWRIHWIIVYFALSIIFGFSFKGIFKVEI
ncbi:MAG: hypothetical protein OEZ45_09725 [Candidatus Aminicenantes bacterium]|nr:hypothetical protein [Candidatus Aminicenantes bacterium]